MGSLDLVILVGLVIGLARGFSTGGIRQLFSLAGIVFAFVFAAQLMQSVGDRLAGNAGISPGLAPIVGFIAIFLVVQVAAYAVSRLLETFLKALKLGIVNRVIGGAIGGFKAMLVLSLTFFAFGFVGIPAPATRDASLFYHTVTAILPSTWNYISERLPMLNRIDGRGDAVAPGAMEAPRPATPN
ncbi:MAG: CvpA family protein [Rhodothermales bacterium]|nr:CvpA family protein [Rhodothermales bacterium]